MSEEKQYYAFISYNHADKKEARELQHWLEYYKLPNKVRRDNPKLPKYVRPLFRDETHLDIGDLTPQICAGLEQSQFLIVICSPRSASSDWVNKEIEYFISLGRQDKILPYIIEGVPHAKNVGEECYPPALLSLCHGKEILGANINESGKDSAAIRVIAKMFGIRADILYQRFQREQRKRWLIIFSAIVAFILLLLSFLFYVIVSNNELSKKNELIEQQNKDITQSRDSTRIALRNVQEKNDTLTLTRLNLENSNAQLTQSNWHAMEVQARAVSIKALELIAEGDIYRGLALVMKIMPYNEQNPERPFIPEMECAIRAANDSILYGGKIKCIMKSHLGCVYDAALTSDNQMVATTSNDNTIRFWNLKTGEEYEKMRTTDFLHDTNYIAFSPNGKYFIKRYSKEEPVLSVWNVKKTGLQFITKLQIGYSPLFSRDGKMLYVRGKKSEGSYSERKKEAEKIYVYDTSTWENVGRADDLMDSLYASKKRFGLLRDTNLYMCNEQYVNRLSFISYKDSTYSKENITFPSWIRFAQQLTISDDIFVTTDNGNSYVCHNPFVLPPQKGVLITSTNNSFAVSTKCKFLVSDNGYVYNIPKSSIEWKFQKSNRSYTGRNMAISNSGNLIAFTKRLSDRLDIVILNHLTNDSIIIRNPFKDELENQIFSLAISDDETKIMAGFRNSQVLIWDIRSKKVLQKLIGHQNGVTSVAFFGKDRYAITSSYDMTTRVWDLQTRKGQEKQMIHMDGSNENPCSSICPNMKYIASSNEEYISIYAYPQNSLVSIIPSSDCVSIWFDAQNNLYSQNIIETDSTTSYNVYKYQWPSIDDLCKKYGYLRSFYLSPEERRKYYLE